jgi:hypothetical protein
VLVGVDRLTGLELDNFEGGEHMMLCSDVKRLGTTIKQINFVSYADGMALFFEAKAKSSSEGRERYHLLLLLTRYTLYLLHTIYLLSSVNFALHNDRFNSVT